MGRETLPVALETPGRGLGSALSPLIHHRKPI